MKSFQQIRSPLIIKWYASFTLPDCRSANPACTREYGPKLCHATRPSLDSSTQSNEPVFSITTEAQDQPAQPKIIIKTIIETGRKRSDLKLLLSILLVLFLIVCALGGIVFLF